MIGFVCASARGCGGVPPPQIGLGVPGGRSPLALGLGLGGAGGRSPHARVGQ